MLVQLYRELEKSQQEMAHAQPWWPCLRCPVARTSENCCNRALFYVSRTEWEYLKRHPFIQQHKQALRKKARRLLRELRDQGLDTKDWTETIRKAGEGALEFTCPLLGSNGKCQAYDNRPTICRAYGMTMGDGEEGIYGCAEVHKAAAGREVRIVRRSAVLGRLRQFASAPSRPIVAWIAEDL